MSAANSTPPDPASKPSTHTDNPPALVNPPATTKSGKRTKPYREFPLTPHPSGRWCKKIRGRLHYFGPIADPDGAVAKYLAQKDDLHAGRTPREQTGAVTVKDAVNAFLAAKESLRDSGELSPRTYTDYEDACREVCRVINNGRLLTDLRPDDFTNLRKRLAKKWGHYRVGKTVQYTRSLFKYAYDVEMIDKPLRFGPDFKRPSKKTIRLHRASQGAKLFTAAEIHALLAIAGPQLKAMILLGINCGFGNSDCGTLPRSAVNLDTGWLDFPRPKTGVDRRAALWPETVQAIRYALAKRPTPKSAADAEFVFITKFGKSWAKDVADSPITKEVRKLLNRAGISGHRNFYTLRHTFRTEADGTKDQVAVNYIMGHESEHMSTVYRERIDDERLQSVAEHVRRWLFGMGPRQGADIPGAVVPEA
jgi:integrase